MNMLLINEAIEQTERELHAQGQWTRKRWLPHTPAQGLLPLLRIDFGAVLSDGTREYRSGYVSIYRDGRTAKAVGL